MREGAVLSEDTLTLLENAWQVSWQSSYEFTLPHTFIPELVCEMMNCHFLNLLQMLLLLEKMSLLKIKDYYSKEHFRLTESGLKHY